MDKQTPAKDGTRATPHRPRPATKDGKRGQQDSLHTEPPGSIDNRPVDRRIASGEELRRTQTGQRRQDQNAPDVQWPPADQNWQSQKTEQRRNPRSGPERSVLQFKQPPIDL